MSECEGKTGHREDHLMLVVIAPSLASEVARPTRRERCDRWPTPLRAQVPGAGSVSALGRGTKAFRRKFGRSLKPAESGADAPVAFSEMAEPS